MIGGRGCLQRRFWWISKQNSIKEIDKTVALITSEYLEGINNIPNEPIKGNNIKVDNKFELNIVVKKVNSK